MVLVLVEVVVRPAVAAAQAVQGRREGGSAQRKAWTGKGREEAHGKDWVGQHRVYK